MGDVRCANLVLCSLGRIRVPITIVQLLFSTGWSLYFSSMQRLSSDGWIEEAERSVGLSFIVMKASEVARARRGAHVLFVRAMQLNISWFSRYESVLFQLTLIAKVRLLSGRWRARAKFGLGWITTSEYLKPGKGLRCIRAVHAHNQAFQASLFLSTKMTEGSGLYSH